MKGNVNQLSYERNFGDFKFNWKEKELKSFFFFVLKLEITDDTYTDFFCS